MFVVVVYSMSTQMMKIKRDSQGNQTIRNVICFAISDFFMSATFGNVLLLFSSPYFSWMINSSQED